MKQQDTIDRRLEEIDQNRASFFQYNHFRLQQAIDKLPERKKEIFKKIPFLIHVNRSGVPGFVKDENVGGIWNFEQSFFFRQVALGASVRSVTAEFPAVQGLYHIGSLGTLTQSRGSDFDYWVIVDEKKLSPRQHTFLDTKLKKIQKYCRDNYHQKVTFYIHDSEKIKHNNFVPLYGENLSIAPGGLLKEEFYRTFILIAGRVPLWSVVPPGLADGEYDSLAEDVFASGRFGDEFLDLGNLAAIDQTELARGVLWHISKSRNDSAKALIKASMAASYCLGGKEKAGMPCDIIKKWYLSSNEFEGSADSYILLFNRVIRFYQERGDSKGLDLIRLAIFFRLCGYPFVAPPSDPFEKKVLGKYIREWHLDKKRVKKMLAYQQWPEGEKTILEGRFINGLAYLYNLLNKTVLADTDLSARARNEVTILKNKTIEYLTEKPGKIPRCSVYLKTRRFKEFVISGKRTGNGKITWSLSSGKVFLYSHGGLFRVMGWLMANQLYTHMFSSITIDFSVKVYDSLSRPVDSDGFYLALQPWPQLSDPFFAGEPFWQRMVVLLVCEGRGSETVIKKSEFLMKNSWGELFHDSLEFDGVEKNQERCYTIAERIAQYTAEGFKFFLFQLSDTPVEAFSDTIREFFELISATGKGMDVNFEKKKPYLDLL
ncbi:MAG: class I adenylate cyclase [Desulfobacteraceae bacterium]